MKRHPALVPLSQEHHLELSLARRLGRAAKGSDAQRLNAGSAYVERFFGPTADHFRYEEDVVFPLYTRVAGPNPLVERVLREHRELHGLAHELRVQVSAGEVAAETLDVLGTLLTAHVRFEEREVFEEIQRAVPAEELDKLR